MSKLDLSNFKGFTKAEKAAADSLIQVRVSEVTTGIIHSIQAVKSKAGQSMLAFRATSKCGKYYAIVNQVIGTEGFLRGITQVFGTAVQEGTKTFVEFDGKKVPLSALTYAKGTELVDLSEFQQEVVIVPTVVGEYINYNLYSPARHKELFPAGSATTTTVTNSSDDFADF